MASNLSTQAKKDSQLDPKFLTLVKAFTGKRDITHKAGSGFGSGALKVKGKIFAMMSSKGQFVVKLPKQRVEELIVSSQGERFDPGHGRYMKQWVAITAKNTPWLRLAAEAYQFVKSESSE
jgi:hypothetical protein